MDAHTTPSAPAGWFLSEHPTEGALVVPLGHTEADVVRDLADGWEPLRLTRVNTSTGRATARPQQGGPARPVVYSSRAGGGWRQGGWWVRFATPRTPEPAPVDEAAETAHAAAQMAPHRSQRATGSSLEIESAGSSFEMSGGDEDEEMTWQGFMGALRAARVARASAPAPGRPAPHLLPGAAEPTACEATYSEFGVKYWKVAGRWVFAGCRRAGGYATVADAQVEAHAQLYGWYVGPLNPEGCEVPRDKHFETFRKLDALAARPTH